jgi:hypothetical protein
MELWEANNCSSTQDIPRILRNQRVRYRILKSPPMVTTLSQMNPVHIPRSYFSHKWETDFRNLKSECPPVRRHSCSVSLRLIHVVQLVLGTSRDIFVQRWRTSFSLMESTQTKQRNIRWDPPHSGEYIYFFFIDKDKLQSNHFINKSSWTFTLFTTNINKKTCLLTKFSISVF